MSIRVRRVGAGVALVCLGSAAFAAGTATTAYWTEDAVVVADETGVELRRFPDFERFSFAESLMAGGRRNKVGGFDVATGERLFTIRNALNPVVAPSGDKVVFLPTFRREPYTRSVWMRGPKGKIRKIAQFRAPGVGGIPHGMGGDGVPLDVALDATGRYVAITFGLETLRSFDVWVVDAKTGEAARMTRGENSHNPSLSPNGDLLAVRVEREESCPDPVYDEILIGKIRVVSRSTGEGRDLTGHDCDVFYDTPRWIDDATVVAVRATKDASEALGYDLDLVKIDYATGEITDLLTEGNPCCVTASPSLGKLAFPYSDRRGFGILDVGTGELLDVDEDVLVPHLSGEGRM